MSKEAYEPDEFDEIAADFPSGAHRRPVKGWHSWLPVLVILILGPTLAWGVFMLVDKSADSNKTTAEQANITSSKQASDQKQSDRSEQGGNSDQVASDKKETGTDPAKQNNEQPAVQPANKELAVKVFNTTKVKGAAAKFKDQLTAQGFKKVEADNGSMKNLDGNTVFYKDEQNKATALEVARTLGINESQVKPAPEGVTLSTPISVFITNA